MIAVIIAGGKGMRMGGLTRITPKPMLHVAGKPILDHQINFLKSSGIENICILLGYLGHVIKNYFGDGKSFGVNIEYFLEDKPRGTSGCVKILEGKIGDDFLVLYGDLMLDVKLDDFIAFHRAKCGSGTLVVHPNDHPCDSDLVVMDDNSRIIDFLPKDRKPRYYANLVSAAIYILSPLVFKYIPEGISSDFVRDVFPLMLRDSEKLYGYKTAEYIKDMGTVDRLEKVNRDFFNGKIHELSKRYKRPAIFMDRDGTLIKDIDLLHKAEDVEIFPFSASAIKKINNSNYMAFLITNQPVVARNLCDIPTVKEIHNKLATLLGEGGVYLNDIYFCPHHPDRDYPGENKEFKIDCNCRKPRIGMVKKAVEEYNVDIESSWFIGDTTTDIQTGINAGMQTILLRTGKGGKDGKFCCFPDLVFDDLEIAIDFILEERYEYDLYIKEILDRIVNDKDYFPFVVSVAGLARSGKSTFVKVLVQTLQKYDISTCVLSLDNWLVSVNDRTEHMTVRQRYKYDEIVRDTGRLINQGKILMKRYDSYSRNIINEEYFPLDKARCLIIDGVPALDIDVLREISNIKVYVKVDENIRKERIFSFYRWKDLPDEEIEHLYQKRLIDEVIFIEDSGKYADIVVEVSKV